MKSIYRASLALTLALSLLLAFAPAGPAVAKTAAKAATAFTAADPMNLDGYVSVVVTSPAKSAAINTVDVKTGAIVKAVDVKPALPFTLGFVPKAYADKESAPLQVILLGASAPKGGVEKAYAIGVLEYEKDGKTRSMVIAGSQKTPYGKLNTMEELEAKFPGAADKIKAWCANAEGKDSAVVKSVKSRPAALNLVGDSILRYYSSVITEDDRRPMDAEGNPTTLDHPKSKNIRFEYGG